MKALIIHLSDIHFKNNKLMGTANKIANAINSSYSRSRICIILVTGDIAYSGKREEYAIAEGFFSELKRLIEKIADNIKFIFCPGNHDCNFSINTTIRDIVLEKVLATHGADINDSIINGVSEIQNEYFEFQDKYQPKENRLVSRNSIKIDKHELLIDSINVSWMSKLKETQGKLIFPMNYLTEPKGTNLRIVMYHHPSNWLEANNSRKFNENMEKNYNLIFAGHEHREKQYSTVDLNSKDHSTYFYGGVLQEHNHHASSFTSIEVDLDKEEFFFKTWKHSEKDGLYLTNEEDCHTFKIGKKIINETTKGILEDSFEKFLNSVEIPFQHPRVQKLTLDKIYTPVNLRANDFTSNEDENIEKIKSDHLHNKIIHENFINILGEPQSGKTTTLKILYKNLLDKGFFPIYIQGDLLKKKQKQEIDSLIKSSIKKQYSSPSFDHIIQTKKERIVILIDNLESSILNEESKDDVINYLSEKFNYIAITMGISSFAASFAINSESSLLSLFKTYNLEEFSYSARGQLIEAWVKLGQEDSLSEHDLDIIVSRKEELLNSLVHSNLLPTQPGHVLLILQYIETGTINPDMSGAYGHIYQSLVTKTLGNSTTFPIDVLNAYLANFAFTIYEKKSTSLDEDEAKISHHSYCNFSDIKIQIEEIIKDLKNLNIIKDINGNISFKHPYLYYYFVAIYMQKRINEKEKIDNLINTMIGTIHRDDSCNILIFYAYLSDHQNIINKLLEKINSEFTEFSPCKFDKDTLEISKLYQEMATTIIINEEPAKKRRQEINKNLDEKLPSTNRQNENDIENNNFEHKLSSCFRSLDVLGQVLRSNRTNLSGEMKNTSVKHGCDMTLRITSSFNKFITEKSNEIISDIKSHIDGKNLTEAEKTTIATRFIATITEMVVFSILKKLSFSLGCQTLKPSFLNLLDERDEKDEPFPSYRLIETMIHLDNSNGFPKNKIESAYKELKEYHLGKRMLQRLVHVHFLKYKVEYDIKQWAQNTLSIKYVTSNKNMDSRKLALPPKKL
ncbi:MAG TPA: metallophosphoesterase [Cellvibrio sp.]|nr:metallophosphoesterase [Cellvibrio sp.]